MKAFAGILMLLFLCGCSERKPVLTGQEGRPMPSFTLLLSDSSTLLNTTSIPKGSPIVLFYFSVNCPYCRAQMTEIIKDIQELKGIQIYAITNDSFSGMKDFYNTFDLGRYPNIVAGLDYSNFFINHFKTTAVPYTAIYDSEKKLSKAYQGIIHISQLKIDL